MDLTEVVNIRLLERYRDILLAGEPCPPVKWEGLGVLVEEGKSEADGWSEVQLAIGAEICSDIRLAVLKELGYTCSAGVSHNKMLAKLCSALNKPNHQTVLNTHAILPFMKTLPFEKIWGLGGKLGHAVEEKLDVQTAGDLWRYDEREMKTMFGNQTGAWLYNIVRGIDFEEGTLLLNSPKSY